MKLKSFVRNNRSSIDKELKRVFGSHIKLNDNKRIYWVITFKSLTKMAQSKGVYASWE